MQEEIRKSEEPLRTRNRKAHFIFVGLQRPLFLPFLLSHCYDFAKKKIQHTPLKSFSFSFLKKIASLLLCVFSFVFHWQEDRKKLFLYSSAKLYEAAGILLFSTIYILRCHKTWIRIRRRSIVIQFLRIVHE